MLNCKEVTELCSQEMERSLRVGERLSLGTHLMMCSGCTNFRKQMKELRLVAQTYAAGGAVLPPSADENPD